MVYQVLDAGFLDHFYLADLTSTAAPREILPPAGGLSIAEESFKFDAQSQYLFLSVSMQLSGGQQGLTIYRAPVSNPSAMQPFFSPAVADRAAYTGYVDADGSRAVVITYGPTDTRLHLTRASDPANPLTLTPAGVQDPDFMMGSYRADWEHNRLLFNIDTLPGAPIYTSTFHVADLVTGSWTALGNLPGDFFRPEFSDVHPSGTAALFETRVNDPSTGIASQIREVDVASGQTRLLEASNLSKVVRYTNDGDTVLLARQGNIATFPRNDPDHPQQLFTEEFATNYRFSPDGKVISVSAAPLTDTFADDSIWAVNQTTASGTFAKRLVRVTTEPFAYVSVGTVAPRDEQD